MTTGRHLYRFRSASALLDQFHELDRQEIYFSSASEQNDPMEGYRDIVWKGDSIAWRNLFRHYGRLLAIATPLVLIDDHPIDAALHLMGAHRFDIHPPTPMLRQGADQAAAAFVAKTPVVRVIEALALRSDPIRREELTFLLKSLHLHALAAVSREPMCGLTEAAEFRTWLEQLEAEATATAPQLDDVLRSSTPGEAPLYGFAIRVARQIATLSAMETDSAPPSPLTFLMLEAPEAYVEHLHTVLYPPAYSACFVEDPGDAAMWSGYADSHRGLCLKFRTRPCGDRPGLDLERVVGWSGHRGSEPKVKRNYVPMKFDPIDYVEAFPEVEFFTAFGDAPVTTLRRDWHFDGETRSEIAASFDDEAAWRKAHWERFEILNLQKTRHWRHERELRLVLASSLSDLAPLEARKATYRFEDLEGVIFGMRTPESDVVKTLAILRAKCLGANRKTFELYQARYDRDGAAMAFDRLSLFERAICSPGMPKDL
jgi:hypothetical protein